MHLKSMHACYLHIACRNSGCTTERQLLLVCGDFTDHPPSEPANPPPAVAGFQKIFAYAITLDGRENTVFKLFIC